jgi:hypothetical protein
MENIMSRTTDRPVTPVTFQRTVPSWIVPAALILMVAGPARPGRAESRMTFASPVEASRALAQAIRNRDERALEGMLGAGPDVTSSGDADVDTLEREQFVRKYEEMHRLVQERGRMVILYLGAENWPFPIPLASRGGRWFFDSNAGAQEILARRIGEHETLAIDACRSLVATGPSIAAALNNETAGGYRFRTIDAVGSTSRSKMITDVRLVAYPVQYRSSGVMTFIVTSSGALYQRDLGPETSRLAEAIRQQVPGSSWVLIPD